MHILHFILQHPVKVLAIWFVLATVTALFLGPFIGAQNPTPKISN